MKHLIIIEDDNKSWKEMRKAWILPRNTHCLLLSCSESHQITNEGLIIQVVLKGTMCYSYSDEGTMSHEDEDGDSDE
jgi:hypothetical protein